MNACPRVLVVDDEPSIRRQLSTSLVQLGFRVDDCERGVSALETLEAARRRGILHHCVILDVRLPDIDGLKILKAVKETYPDLPVIVISGFGDARVVEQVQEYNGQAFLDKPFELHELEAELHRISPRAARPQPITRTQAAVGTRRMESAYVLVRAKPGADLSQCFNKLYYGDGVCYCDAVVGDWDIVLLLHAPDTASLEQLAARHLDGLPEVAEYRLCTSERPRLSQDLESFIRSYDHTRDADRAMARVGDRRNRQLLSAYAIVEIDKTMLPALYPKFYFNDNVVYCDMTEDCSTAILLVQGRTFDEMRAAEKAIRDNPGVLRTKLLHIMEMFDM